MRAYDVFGNDANAADIHRLSRTFILTRYLRENIQ
jgi:hypothetical protein